MTADQSIDERRRILRDRFPVWRPCSLGEWLDRCAENYAARPLVLSDTAESTYAEIAEASRRLAAGLHTLGVRPGDRVGLLMANYPEFVTAKFAIARTGAIAVPFNYLYQERELGFVVADSGCRVLITMTHFRDLDYQAMLDGIAPGWDRDGFAERAQDLDAVPGLRHVVVHEVDSAPRPDAMSLQQLGELGEPTTWTAAGVGATEPGDMLYTSGTTGSPKGVVVSHDAVLRTAYASALTRAYQDGRRILYALPCYHMFGYVEGLLSAMFVGGAVILQPSFSAEGYFDGVQRHRATDLLCVPTMAVAMVESSAAGRYDLSSLSSVLCGSAPAPKWLWDRFSRRFGVTEIVTGYGMTECGGAMTLTLPEDSLALTSETVGRPKLAGCAGVDGNDALATYRAVDPESGAVLPAGEEGELVSSGPTVMAGYWNRPDETRHALRGGWLRSGDLGIVRSDGYLQVTGRSKELYKSGGELVMPKEVEDVLDQHPQISQVFAVGLVDERWGEIGCAVVVPAPEADIDVRDVLDLCRARLARFKVPKRVVFYRAEDLPVTPTGKVQKFRLVEELQSGAVPAGSQAGANSATPSQS